VFINWLGLAIRIGTAIVLLPFIVESLGVDSYGEYVFLAAIFGYSELLEFGLRAAILRYTGKFSGRREYGALNRILGTVFSYYAVAALAVIGLGAVLYFSPPEWILPVGASSAFSLYAGLFALVSASTFFRIGWSSVLRANERYDLLNLIDIVGFLLRALVIVVLLLRGYGLVAVIIGDIVDNVFTALGSRFAVGRVAPQIRLDFHRLERSELHEVLGYSGWAFLNSVAFQLRFRGPSVIVGGVLSTGAAGFFGVAARLQGYVFQLGTAMNSPFRARATLLAGSSDDDAVRTILYRGTKYLTFLASTLCALLFLYAHPLLVTWMGEDFHQTAPILQILLVGLGCEISALMLGGALYATGHLRAFATTNLVEAGFIVGLSYWLSHTHGLVGAAVGVSLPLVVNKALVQPVVLLKILSVEPRDWLGKALFRPLLTLTIGVGPVLLIREMLPPASLFEVFLHLVAGGTIQLVLAWFIIFDREERAEALRAVGLKPRTGSL
jgi:O-antigen/teichoic acid export membrane protein